MDTVQNKIAYFNELFYEIKNGQEISLAMYEFGFCDTLYQLIQEYPISTSNQKVLIEESLNKSVNIILSYLMPIDLKNKNTSVFPVSVFYNNLLTTALRDTYIEGDLQISLLLLRISFILKNGNLFSLANMIACFAKTKEKEYTPETMSIDFKTGTIGVALLYQTMFFLTDLEYYKKQAEFWYLNSENGLKNMTESMLNINLINYLETQRAFEAFNNPQNDTWRRMHFLEYDINEINVFKNTQMLKF
jgi:hypothetical protein